MAVIGNNPLRPLAGLPVADHLRGDELVGAIFRAFQEAIIDHNGLVVDHNGIPVPDFEPEVHQMEID